MNYHPMSKDLFHNFFSDTLDQFILDFFKQDNIQRVKDLAKNKALYPKVDVYNLKNGDIKIEAAIPGLEKEDISLTLEQSDNNLHVFTISARSQSSQEIEQYQFKELKRSAFQRSWLLDSSLLDLEREISADLKNGILHIIIPIKSNEKRIEKKEIKQITIN